MRKSLILLIISTMIFASLAGCTTFENSSQTSETIKLYYGDENNEQFVTEEQAIEYKSDENKYVIALEALINGPTNEQYQTNIPQGTKVLDATLEGNNLTVNLSGDFNQFAGSVQEVIAVGSIVNTLTQFKEVAKVKILVDGNELVAPSGKPRGFMGPFEQNQSSNEDNNTPPESTTIKLYFSDQQATGVIAEEREINADPNQQTAFITAILEELIKGPQRDDFYQTIPKEVKVLSVDIKDNVAYIDFSEEMHTKHWGGATGEMQTIASIVNTLTEFDDIHKVKLTVAGEPLSIEHAILEEPVGRYSDMILK